MDITQVYQVPIGDIQVGDHNVRTDLSSPQSQEGIIELAENIRLNGLLQPIVLKGVWGQPPYNVIVGQRRFKAHEYLEAPTIEATFSGNIDPIQALLLSLSENICRQEMNYRDTSEAITTLYNHFNKDERLVKNHTGFSIRTIRSYLKLKDQATEKINYLLDQKVVSMTQARRALDAAQGDKEKADAIIDQLVHLTKYEQKRLVESGTKKPSASVEELIQDAQKPKIEETVILTLTLRIHNALRKASEQLSLDMEEVTLNALTEWLTKNEFLIG